MIIELVLAKVSILAAIDRANVWFLAGVSSLVVVSVAQHREILPAKTAFERLAPCVGTLVHLNEVRLENFTYHQVWFRTEGSVTGSRNAVYPPADMFPIKPSCCLRLRLRGV